MKRRAFIKQIGLMSAAAGYATAFPSCKTASVPRLSNFAALKGFNLLNKFNPHHQTEFQEQDFEIMAEWGFNFARIPLSYWCWSSENDWYSVDEKVIKDIDRVVKLGQQYRIHINLNFHRAPGYCINRDDSQPVITNLFEDEEPLKACEFHWRMFAERYKDYSSKYLSFNLINEAPSIEAAKYDRVARRLITAIRSADKDRLVFIDGKDVGAKPLMTVTDIPNIVQSGRGYQPFLLTHLRATWADWKPLSEVPIEEVRWPLIYDGKTYDKDFLREASVNPWKPWIEAGGIVHIGEMGCHNFTPHSTVTAWMDDLLSVFDEQNWGWSLWNLAGSFGVLNSGRKDVKYENYKGFRLDRQLLEVLKKHL
ncbi:MAG: cellulase family glycosylhydrolase [Dysgonamonadaceae bacterium]|jgi:endoglucanase|nr:cellulase family glycosylhydrolase [Dysgonamonadaceae bacterium]